MSRLFLLDALATSGLAIASSIVVATECLAWISVLMVGGLGSDSLVSVALDV
jgi:hypothetical protein